MTDMPKKNVNINIFLLLLRITNILNRLHLRLPQSAMRNIDPPNQSSLFIGVKFEPKDKFPTLSQMNYYLKNVGS